MLTITTVRPTWTWCTVQWGPAQQRNELAASLSMTTLLLRIHRREAHAEKTLLSVSLLAQVLDGSWTEFGSILEAKLGPSWAYVGS